MRADQVVELLRGNAGDDVRDQRVEDLGGEPSGAPHAFEAFRPVQLDDAIARLGTIVGGNSDVLSHCANIGTGRLEVEREPGRLADQTRQWTAALVVIGDEILSGRTQDKNVAQLASWLNMQGIRLVEVRIVPDVLERIGEAVNALRATHDYLFTTGGIGPTHDDITVDAMAAAFGVPVVVHPEARAILEEYYRGRPGGLTEARLRMARVPQGAELIANPSSGAPGVKMGNVYILAGVPHIAGSMLEALTGKLEGGRPVVSATIGARAPESDVADLLRETEAAHPGVAIGSYPFFKDGRYGANFVIRSEDGESVAACARVLAEGLRAAGFDPVEGGI
jgi:molybdenum cofactor synthesis domain-containing protein